MWNTSKSGIWLRQGSKNNKIVIRAAIFLPEESLFKDATFYIYTKKNNFIERIDAKSAKLEKDFWIMKNVIINRPNKKVIKIDEYTLKTNLSIKKIEDSFLDPQSLSIWKIPNSYHCLKSLVFLQQNMRCTFIKQLYYLYI